MILLHSVDVYQHIHVLWTKYCTELDTLDPLQCNNTVFVGILWISGLSGGFICEFLQFCYCLFGCWWSDKDTDCTCCVDCILKCLTSFESEEFQLSRDIWHVQIFVVVVFVSDELYPLRGQCTAGGTLELQQVNCFDLLCGFSWISAWLIGSDWSCDLLNHHVIP